MQSLDTFFSSTQLTRMPSRESGKQNYAVQTNTGRQTLWVGAQHCKLYLARTYDVSSRHLVVTAHHWMHTRFVILQLHNSVEQSRTDFKTNTAEKAHAGTVDQCLDSSGFLLYPKQQPSKCRPRNQIYPRRDVMDSAHILMLVGKVYWNRQIFWSMSRVQSNWLCIEKLAIVE